MKYAIKENRPGGKEYAFFHMSSSLPAMSAAFLSKSTCLQMDCRRIERCTHMQKHTKEHTANGNRKIESSDKKAKQAQKNTPQTEREKAKHANDKFSGVHLFLDQSFASLFPAIARLCARVQFDVRQRKMAVMHQKLQKRAATHQKFQKNISEHQYRNKR